MLANTLIISLYLQLLQKIGVNFAKNALKLPNIFLKISGKRHKAYFHTLNLKLIFIWKS